ncbi:unnamed protein product [Aphanomyces euteiches]
MAYRLTEDAQVVMGLHAAQYPHLNVLGLLVGRESGESIEITQAFPLTHEFPTAPVLEFASMSVEAYAARNKLRIVGLYVANARAEDVALGPVHTRIANTVEGHASRACVLVLDNKALAKPFLWLKDVKRGWVRVENRLSLDDAEGKVLYRSLEGNKPDVVDFDDHLEDLKKDWKNPQVTALAKLQV